MSENATPQAPAQAPETPKPAPPTTTAGTDWKSESRKWEARAKENSAAAEELKKLRDAQKSETERANERAQQAEAALSAAENRAMLAEVAAAKGVPAGALQGATREEAEAAADALLAWRKPDAPKEPQAPSDSGAGGRGEPIGSPKQLTRDDIKSMSPGDIVAARKDGRMDELMGKAAS